MKDLGKKETPKTPNPCASCNYTDATVARNP